MKQSGKQKICDALMVLAENRGVSEVPISALIAEAGINRSTFYYHFNGTEAVLEYMMRDFCTQYFNTLRIPAGQTAKNLESESQKELENRCCAFIAGSGHYVHFFLNESNYWRFRKIFRECHREYCKMHRIIQTFPNGHTELLRHGVFYDYYIHMNCLQLFAILECWAERNFSEKEEDFVQMFNLLHSTVITFQGDKYKLTAKHNLRGKQKEISGGKDYGKAQT